MNIRVDISGRVDDNNKTYMAFADEDNSNFKYSIVLDAKVKRSITIKYLKITDFWNKFHATLVYYCIKDYLDRFENATTIHICPDGNNPAKLKKYITDRFTNNLAYLKIKDTLKITPVRVCSADKYTKLLRKEKLKPHQKLTYHSIAKFLK